MNYNEVMKWKQELASNCVQIEDNVIRCLKEDSEGLNYVVGSEPLTRDRSCFALCIRSTGYSLAIGAKVGTDPLDKASLEDRCFMHKFNQREENDVSFQFGKPRKEVLALDEDTEVQLQVDFASCKLHLWINGRYETSSLIEIAVDAIFYPVMIMTVGSNVTTLRVDTKLQAEIPSPPTVAIKSPAASPSLSEEPIRAISVKKTNWKWSSTIPKGIQIDKSDVAKYVKVDGSNPCILASSSFSETHNHFRIKVIKMGTFLVVGASLQGENQNVAYYSQPAGPNGSGIHHIVLTGQRPKPAAALHRGDIVDMYIDNSEQKIFFWRNESYEGCLRFEHDLMDTELYPSVTLGDGSEVAIVNNTIPKLITDPRKTPTFSWAWSMKKKAQNISVTEQGKVGTNKDSGIPCGLIATDELTRKNNHFRVKVEKIKTYFYWRC